MNRRDAPAAAGYFDCLDCGHRHEIRVIPPQCPVCGSHAAKRDEEAEARAELFRRAAAKAKGLF
jgi:Zn finger protein HypA/HybF involved in hydrogenase expression